jgi:hypothetical protein
VAVARSAAAAFSTSLPEDVINLQRLTMGKTFSIVGVIFLAAARRSR